MGGRRNGMRLRQLRDDPRVRRYQGVALVAAAAVGLAIAQGVSPSVPAPSARCASGRAGAVAIAVPSTVRALQPNTLRASIASCDSQGAADLALLVSSPPSNGTTPAFPGDLGIGDVDGCDRDGAAGNETLFLCGALPPHQTRTVSITVEPPRFTAVTSRLTVTAVDVGRGGITSPRLLDAASVDLPIAAPSSSSFPWVPWVLVVVAVGIGVDMARRSRSGFRWAVGMLVFSVLGWLVWIRDRTRWETVPAGSPPVPAIEPRWTRAYGVAVGLAVPAVIICVIVAGVVLETAGSHSSGAAPAAVATPAPAPTLSVPGPTPCAGGELPAAVSTATRLVSICAGTTPDVIVLHSGDTLGLVLPSGAVGAGSTVEVVGQEGTDVVVDTGLGTSSAALLLAEQPGTAVVQVYSVCQPLSGQCGSVPQPATTVTVRVDAR